MSRLPKSDTTKIKFGVRVRSVEYGDKRTFFEYQILLSYRGRVAGIEEGPRRRTLDRASAICVARRRITVLRSYRLFVIGITRKHIDDGEARDCNTCAIAQALWHNQERMGLPKSQFRFEVSPYGGFIDPRGIVLADRYGDHESTIPAPQMPLLVNRIIKGRTYPESMPEWAMRFDEWAESRYMSLAEWREEHGYDDDERPYRPAPCSFVLNLDDMRTSGGGL